MSPHSITLVGMLLRGLQLTFAVAAMTTAFMSLPLATASNGNVFRLGSFEITFVVLVSYTIVEYAGVLIFLVELFPIVHRPRLVSTRVLDAILVMLVLVSGIKLALSEYVQDCDDYARLVDCDNLIMSSVFTISCVVPLICSIVLTFVRPKDSKLELDHSWTDNYRVTTPPRNFIMV